MKWTVIDTVVCPSTGTFFSKIVSENNFPLIIWYSGVDMLDKNGVVTPGLGHVYKDDKPFNLDILKVIPGNERKWHCLKNNMGCPGNTDFITMRCIRRKICVFDVCPWIKQRGRCEEI